MPFQKTKTASHRIFARSDNFVDVDAKLPDRALGTALGDEFPSLERVADAGEVLPLNTGTRLDMEHRKFGPGYQCDLQGVHEGDFAGLGKIRRMKNGFYFDCLKRLGLTHNPVFFLLVAGSGVVIVVRRKATQAPATECDRFLFTAEAYAVNLRKHTVKYDSSHG